MRRLLFIFALLALVLGGPVVRATEAGPLATVCRERCGALVPAQAVLPPCCPGAREGHRLQASLATLAGPRELRADWPGSDAGKEPSPWPGVLIPSHAWSRGAAAARGVALRPVAAPGHLPGILTRTCILRI